MFKLTRPCQECIESSPAITKPCDLCNESSFAVLSTKDRKGDPLRTIICTNCGLIRTDPVPEEDQLREFYATKYRREYKGTAIPKRKHLYRDAQSSMRRFRFLKAVLNPEDRILDIGSGNGVFVYVLSQLGFNAYGVEPDEDNSEFAREYLHVDVRTGFARDITEEGAFDVVTLHHVLEHLRHPLEELRHIWKLLRPNGCLMLEVPNAEDTWQDPGNRYHKAHLFTFDSRTITAMVEKAGFAVRAEAVALFNKNITLLLQKLPEGSFFMSPLTDNYSRIRRTIGCHVPSRYYLSLVPYKKFYVNTVKKLREQLLRLSIVDDKNLIDAVIKNINDDIKNGYSPEELERQTPLSRRAGS